MIGIEVRKLITISSDLIVNCFICMRNCYLTQRVIPGKVGRNEEDIKVHHIVDDDLYQGSLFSLILQRCFERITVKSVGSDVSQLRVHPTVGLNRAARSLAKALTPSIAVWFVESLM